MLLSEETECFCFLAGHESFAAAEGAIKIALNANKVRVKPLRVILNGLGKDAAYIISRINGFTYVETEFDPYAEEVKVVYEKPFSKGARAAVKCYGADNVPEGVAIMKLEKVGVSITGNSTNPTRFQHPVAGTYKKWCVENANRFYQLYTLLFSTFQDYKMYYRKNMLNYTLRILVFNRKVWKTTVFSAFFKNHSDVAFDRNDEKIWLYRIGYGRRNKYEDCEGHAHA